MGVYKLNISVTHGNLSSYAVLTINIIDVNERHYLEGLPNAVTVNAGNTGANTVVSI